jgi:hypothetical protein
MNSQLHDVLEQHSSDIHDLPIAERLASIHGRVRVVRRRRRAGVAGAAAAVIAAVGVAVWLPSPARLDPAAHRDLAGHAAPETMESLGYTYAFAQGIEGDGKVTLELPPSDEPRLVSWASSENRGQLVLPSDIDDNGPDTVPMGTKTGGFDRYEWVYPGAEGTITAQGPGEVAIAVYTRTDAAPAGVTKDGVTFRDDLDGNRLINAAIGDAGQGELVLQVPVPERELRLHHFCYGVPVGYQMNVSINGELNMFGACDDPRPSDGGAESSGFRQVPDGHGGTAAPGTSITVRMWLTEGDGEDNHPSQEAVDAPGVHLGIGLYEAAPARNTVGSWSLPEELEYAGHHWRYAEVSRTMPGGGSLRVSVSDGSVPQLVVALGDGLDQTVQFLLDGKASGPVVGTRSFRAEVAVVEGHGVDAELRAQGDLGLQAVLALATYFRID